MENELAALRERIAALEAQLSKPKRYVYRTSTHHYIMSDEEMAELQEGGWELVTSHRSEYYEGYVTYWLRRPATSAD